MSVRSIIRLGGKRAGQRHVELFSMNLTKEINKNSSLFWKKSSVKRQKIADNLPKLQRRNILTMYPFHLILQEPFLQITIITGFLVFQAHLKWQIEIPVETWTYSARERDFLSTPVLFQRIRMTSLPNLMVALGQLGQGWLYNHSLVQVLLCRYFFHMVN